MAKFRNFLLHLSEHLTSKNVADMKFLLGGPTGVIPDGILEQVKSARELFEHMELKQLLSSQDITTLKFLITEIQRRDLLDKLNDYEENNSSACDEVEQTLKSVDISEERVQLEGKSGKEDKSTENDDACEGQVSPPYSKTSPEEHSTSGRKDYFSLPPEKKPEELSPPRMYQSLPSSPSPSRITPTTLNSPPSSLKNKRSPSPQQVLRPPSFFEKKNKSPNLPRLNVDAKPDLTSQRSSQYVRPEEYDMGNDPHGDCVIISNHFDVTVNASNNNSELKKRTGTERDEQVLKETFEYLKFEVRTYTNLSAGDIFETLHFYASQKEQAEKDCFVCCILSHGYEGGIYGNDGKAIDTKSIKSIFSGDNCPVLLRKPKLFFIQACQGESDSKYVRLESDGAQSDGNSSPITQDHLSMIEIETPQQTHCYKEFIAADADILFFMATTPGTISWRDTVHGSWFVQTLCQVFREFSNWNLMDLILKVNDLISKKNADIGDSSGGVAAQMSNLRDNTLRKQLHFFPENFKRRSSSGASCGGKTPAESP